MFAIKYWILLILAVLISSIPLKASDITYIISFPEPQTHYIHVEINISGLNHDTTYFQLPVWTPGSYKIRDFAMNVESFEAFTSDKERLKSSKTSKNTWKVENGPDRTILVKYKVYAFEMSVRTSYVDEHHAYLNGSSVFMYVPGYTHLPAILHVNPRPEWKRISTALQENGRNNQYVAENFEQLIDCPLEIGNHELFSFNAAGVLHEVAMFGPGNYDPEKLCNDMAKLVEVCTDVFGENPNEYYLFIIHNVETGGGGLEHSNSTTLQVNRWEYQPENRYKGFLGLVVHEYFHLWNVKRIRPAGFWDIDYSRENYTDALWMMEGFTSYYDEILLRRAGFFTDDEYLRKLAGALNSVDNRPGNQVQSVTEASFDAWIKFYQQNENTWNTTVSYYTKGNILAAMLDLEIIHSTRGIKNLDDVMRILYENNYKKTRKGITTEDIKNAIETITGKEFDLFFENHVFGTMPLDYSKYLEYAGLELFNMYQDEPVPQLGVSMKIEDGRLLVNNVIRGSSAYEYGINVNDEIIAMDGFRVDDSFSDKIRILYDPSDTVCFLLARNGIIMEKEVVLKTASHVRYTIYLLQDISKMQKIVREKWFTDSL